MSCVLEKTSEKPIPIGSVAGMVAGTDKHSTHNTHLAGKSTYLYVANEYFERNSEAVFKFVWYKQRR